MHYPGAWWTAGELLQNTRDGKALTELLAVRLQSASPSEEQMSAFMTEFNLPNRTESLKMALSATEDTAMVR